MNLASTKTTFSPTKRPFDPSEFDDNDGENVDPALLFSPSKKSKSDGIEKPTMPFTFSLSQSKSMPPPPTVPARLSTPSRANMSSPRAPMTAPAGRSPKRKSSSLNKNRRISAPFTRIDPPFASRNTSTLPFSLDAALSGTFSSTAPKDAGATIQESMPKNWFFDIYVDTPEEESATLMEHSTLTLDLSSDEESDRKAKDDRGKENMPPEGYDPHAASRPIAEPTVGAPKQIKKSEIIRQKIIAADDMDDGQRSPLSDLETDPFIPEGLAKDSHIIVNPTPEKASSDVKLPAMTNLFATPVAFTSGGTVKSNSSTSVKSLYDMPVVNADGDVKGDIIVWEDSPSSEPSDSSVVQDVSQSTPTKSTVVDENTIPVAKDVAL